MSWDMRLSNGHSQVGKLSIGLDPRLNGAEGNVTWNHGHVCAFETTGKHVEKALEQVQLWKGAYATNISIAIHNIVFDANLMASGKLDVKSMRHVGELGGVHRTGVKKK